MRKTVGGPKSVSLKLGCEKVTKLTLELRKVDNLVKADDPNCQNRRVRKGDLELKPIKTFQAYLSKTNKKAQN